MKDLIQSLIYIQQHLIVPKDQFNTAAWNPSLLPSSRYSAARIVESALKTR